MTIAIQPHEPRFLLATAQVECVTFTLAYALSEGGAQVDIFPMPGALEQEVSKWYVDERILRLPRVRMVDQPKGVYDRVVYEAGARRPEAESWGRVLSASAFRVRTVVVPGFEGGLWRRWKASLGFLWRHREMLAHAWRWVWMAVFPRGLDATTALGRRVFLGVDVHANFLTEGELHRAMFEEPWVVGADRPYPFNYVGSEKPEARHRVLNEIKGALAGMGVDLGAARDCPPGAVPWAVNGGVEPANYCGILNCSDFTLCPEGFVAWTHRVVESLCRGSIPILSADTAELYGMPLVHGENCWLVFDNDWGGAVTAAAATSFETRVKMRRTIAGLYDTHLSPSACARAMRVRLGCDLLER